VKSRTFSSPIPKIANAVVRSAQRAYIIGAAVGQTNIFFFDADGQPIASYDIAVTRDLNGVRAALRQALPSSDVNIEGVGDGVVLTGSVNNPVEPSRLPISPPASSAARTRSSTASSCAAAIR
jgi:Flp pilus assembly secretin CpaC